MRFKTEPFLAPPRFLERTRATRRWLAFLLGGVRLDQPCGLQVHHGGLSWERHLGGAFGHLTPGAGDGSRCCRSGCRQHRSVLTNEVGETSPTGNVWAMVFPALFFSFHYLGPLTPDRRRRGRWSRSSKPRR